MSLNITPGRKENPYAQGDKAWALKHRTGRTHRMLVQAVIEAVKNGRAVYVVAADSHHQHTLEAMLESLHPPQGHGVKVENAQMFPELDWSTMTMPRAHPNCLVLVDHYTIEKRHATMLAMWHAFDENASPRETPARGD